MNLEIVSNDICVAALRDGIEGSVYVPGDPGYEMASQAWNLVVVQRPQVIVEVETAADVQAAVRFARTAGLPVAVMATGHGVPRGCDGVLILTGRMAGVQVDPEMRVARVQGGARVRDVLNAAAPYGLAMLSGSSPNVGIVGYTLGGGYGLMVRKHGLAIDQVRAATIVTPDGELVRADAYENADLFWAIRGGGGAFGVIAEMAIELVPQANVFGGVTFYAADHAEAILQAYASWSRAMPEEVSSTALLMNLPPLPSIPAPLRGRAVVAVNACVCGDLVDAEKLVQPMRKLGMPVLDA